jgi:hypothetical protein
MLTMQMSFQQSFVKISQKLSSLTLLKIQKLIILTFYFLSIISILTVFLLQNLPGVIRNMGSMVVIWDMRMMDTPILYTT